MPKKPKLGLIKGGIDPHIVRLWELMKQEIEPVIIFRPPKPDNRYTVDLLSGKTLLDELNDEEEE